MASTAIGTLTPRTTKPRPCPRSKETTPPAARGRTPSRPTAPPLDAGRGHLRLQQPVSRVPGAPPRMTPEATLAVSKTTTVAPVAKRASCALPTRTPADR